MPKGIAKTGKRTLYQVECQICKQMFTHTGMNGHIATHGIPVFKYVEKYGEYRKNKTEEQSFQVQCEECGELLKSQRQLTFHIRTMHNMSGEEYATKHIFKFEPQVCKCGCGALTQLLPRPPWRRDYLPGHNPNGMTGRLHSAKTKAILTEKSISRFAKGVKTGTKPEYNFEEILKSLNLTYQTQVQTEAGVCDFYIEEIDSYVEVDGEYWHPLVIEGLNIQLLSSAVSDFKKNSRLPNLIRLRSQDISNIRNVEDILRYDRKSEYPTFIPSYYTKIITRQYLTHKHKEGVDSLLPHLYLFLKSIRLFQPDFPNFETKENLQHVLQSIPTKISTVYNPVAYTFNNNCSSLGNSFLKSIFKSYWKSSYKTGKSPYEIWQDDELMNSIIKYRIGLNKTGEVYDFSLHNLVKGISAIRGTVSFFKPVLAAAIYSHFLNGKTSPKVLDPCAGFGGRMLGFKSMYPQGVYIGIEPNVETYNELQHLKRLAGFDDSVQLLNIKFEEYKQYSETFDLIFTSIPYYDLETYSNPVVYENEHAWARTFLTEFSRYLNVVLNVPLPLEKYFTTWSSKYYMIHNASHLSKEKIKRELILKL